MPSSDTTLSQSPSLPVIADGRARTESVRDSPVGEITQAPASSPTATAAHVPTGACQSRGVRGVIRVIPRPSARQ